MTTQGTTITEMRTAKDFRNLIAMDIMTEKLITAKASDTVAHVSDLLYTHSIRHIPIVDDGGRLLDVISERDVQGYSLPIDKQIQNEDEAARRFQLPIRCLCSEDPITIDPSTPLEDVIDILIEQRIGALPVVRETDGVMEGIVSYIDVLKVFREANF